MKEDVYRIGNRVFRTADGVINHVHRAAEKAYKDCHGVQTGWIGDDMKNGLFTEISLSTDVPPSSTAIRHEWSYNSVESNYGVVHIFVAKPKFMPIVSRKRR